MMGEERGAKDIEITRNVVLVIRSNQGFICVEMAGAGDVSLIHRVLASQQRVTMWHDIINLYTVSED
jgi:hypothetical protein